MEDPDDRLSNGQFAPKRRGRPKEKGCAKTGGRKKGTPNKVTRKVKEFLAALVDKAEVQDAIEERIIRGDAVAFFRALEHVIGKPKETTALEHSGTIRVEWGGE